MKRAVLIVMGLVAILMVLIGPSPLRAESQAPPIGAPLVREGAYAVRLAEALELGAGGDELLAQTRLGELGIAPRNGWIADYPVTPDIVGELQQAIIAAADSGRLRLGRDESLRRFFEVNAKAGLGVVPYADDAIRRSSTEYRPDSSSVNNYYNYYGPPVVTYYAPPSGFIYMYGWVPFPFWYYGFWFPGFYVLHDFHTRVVYGGSIVYVSNHYRHPGQGKVYIVDPVRRYHSRPVYGLYPAPPAVVYRGNPAVARQIIDYTQPRVPERSVTGGPPAQRERGSASRPVPERRTPSYPDRMNIIQQKVQKAQARQDERQLPTPKIAAGQAPAQPRQMTAGKEYRFHAPLPQEQKVSDAGKTATAPRESRAVRQPAPAGPKAGQVSAAPQGSHGGQARAHSPAPGGPKGGQRQKGDRD